MASPSSEGVPAVTTRREQLRAAKQRQRRRDRSAGFRLYQIKLPSDLCERLKAGMREPRFVDRLHAFLREELIPVDDYPGLRLLCWNRRAPYVTRREAFALYERNWRFVDARATPEHERALIDALAHEFGHGLINA